MPKAEKGTPKDIAKRIKAKGLQKLKFYCQMCQKQCRDANGFKCHIQSESHLRQMKLFSENASGIMDRYSKEFEKVYLDTLRMRHSTKLVNANNVYQEVIQDKQHIHMNATIWATLTDFVKYLGKTGKCHVEEDERGWYVQYIERDVAKLARQEALQKRQEAEQAAEEALSERMEKQRVEAAKALDRAGGTLHAEATKLERDGDGSGEATVQVSLKKTTKLKTSGTTSRKPNFVFAEEDDEDDEAEEEHPPSVPLPDFSFPQQQQPQNKKKRPREFHDNHQKREESPKKKSSRPDDAWLYRDILVRIINKELAGGKYFKRKAAVDTIDDDNDDYYTAQVIVLDSGPDQRDGGDVLRLDQEDLETVIPKQAGKAVRVLRGRYRGKRATVVELDKKRYRAVLELQDGTILDRVDYEDFSKVA